MIAKQTAVDTLHEWIVSCRTADQLEVCRLAVQDLLWTRYNDEEDAIMLQRLINVREGELLQAEIIGHPIPLS